MSRVIAGLVHEMRHNGILYGVPNGIIETDMSRVVVGLVREVRGMSW